VKDATTKPAPAPKTVPVKPPAPAPTASEAPRAAAASPEDRLVAVGEKYLYGNGVAENCAVAQKNLRAAAQRSNAKAQSILGTMYATGHCVDRDLPMAYRWFAKALHQDPSNNRIQRDLEVLWRQMTADERQLAIRP
jgi:TPR repeat protein